MPKGHSKTRGANEKRVVYNEGEADMVAIQLNRLAREQLKHRLLADIQTDIMVCQLEGWDYKEYLIELRELINHFIKE